MVKERHRASGRLAFRAAWALLLIAVPASARGDGPPIRLSDATASGVFNVGDARATVDRVELPPDAGGTVLRLNYTLPRGTAAGIWAKAFPPGLDPKSVDLVRVAAEAQGQGDPPPVNFALEIKGTRGTQRIPIAPGGDPKGSEHPIAWGEIGEVSEVVVSASRTGDAEVAAGSIQLDIRFDRLSWMEILGRSSLPAMGRALLASALAAAIFGLIGAVVGSRMAGRRGPARDLVQGIGTVLVLALGATIYHLGEPGTEPGWWPVGLAVAGAAVAAWWSVGLAGRWPTAAEAFRDAAATGLLAAASSPMAILEVPGAWTDLARLSALVAAVAAMLYHFADAARLSTAGRHLGAAAGALIVGTPFVLGSLVLLSTGGLVSDLGSLLSAGSLADRPELLASLGRVAVLFGFNEAVAFGLGMATRGHGLRSLRGHLGLLAVAVLAVVAPHVADFGSGAWVASYSAWGRWPLAVATAALSQAGLWAEVYLVTGLLTDAIGGVAPSRGSTLAHPWTGMKKGAIYAGTYIGILYGLGALWTVPAVRGFAQGMPVLAATLLGMLAFPLVKTIFETFDGSQGFFGRVARSYRDPRLYARGIVVGLALGLALAFHVAGWTMSGRVAFGLIAGALAYGGVDLAADTLGASRGRRRVEPARFYLAQGLLGGFIGAALGFYFDLAQVAVVASKFHQYLGVHTEAFPYDVRPLLERWGTINLGTQTGGVKLLFDEALAGVISFAVPAWLFAINRTFLAAYFEGQAAPIRSLFSRAGSAQLVRDMIGVLRWGLWMSPIVKSFLRPMGDPTWYNQDGAIRTGFAIVHDLTSSPDAFRAWSLNVFVALLAYDAVRVLIWLDHFGLRVATLVNLSFLGTDRLDHKLARFLAPASTARVIPEAVKRFTTWAPLLIPYYIPRGTEWDEAWNRSQAIIQANAGGGVMASFYAMPAPRLAAIAAGAALAATAGFAIARLIRSRAERRRPRSWTLRNADYELTLSATGGVVGHATARGYDLSRRSYDGLDPAGRALFLVDEQGSWPVVGQFPGGRAGVPQFERADDALRIVREADGLRATVTIRLDGAAEVWEVAVENATDSARSVKVVPYLEWVLNKPEADRGHTQYNRLFAEMEYAAGLHAVLAWDKHAKAMGVLASDVAPAGFLTSRVDFIGRARSIRSPRALETLAFSDHQDTDAHPTFDPIGSLLLPLNVPARGSASARLVYGLVANKPEAIALVDRVLQIPGAASHPPARRRKERHSIGHGEIPPGTPRPYCTYSDDGRTMTVRTPFTPRPFDHTMSNALGHVVSVTNRGFNTTSSVNAQQNRITPDWSDTVTREVPPEAFYLYDAISEEWFSPTYHPLNDPDATYETDFGVDGTATFRMRKGDMETELTVFVPPDRPAGIYRLTVRNRSARRRHFGIGAYFQIVLAAQPEFSGPLRIVRDGLCEVTLTNPRNTFRRGPVFIATSKEPNKHVIETSRGRFFGPDRDVARPALLAGQRSHVTFDDDRPIAALISPMTLKGKEEHTIIVELGQADTTGEAAAALIVNQESANSALESTRAWWLSLMETVRIRTGNPEFDHYLDWLKYQALAERIWARRGFYQASGAFGFRDQLQDSVNLIWADPALARRQILLHASQQFIEGDVVHWFHQLQDGRTGFVGRSHASDNLLWLAWGVVDYVGATGDDSVLGETATYLGSELPFPPLPAGKHGMGFDPLRTSREDTIYRHCLRAIDLVLDRRMGAHGIPLMGTGDWNDGLDEIGSEGRGESVWLGLFLYYILDRMVPIVGRAEGKERMAHYEARLRALGEAIETTWRGDRYLRAIHDDGTEIGVKDSGIWEIDALTASWAVMAGINPDRARTVFETALDVLEQEDTILLGWPPLREDTKPYLGRSSWYPEGVRENGMYCHGVQWLVGAARILADQAAAQERADEAQQYRETAYRLWHKIAAIGHADPEKIEIYGGQPNKQAADMVTTFDPGRMIWNGYTGAAGWMFRQAIEGVLGYRLEAGRVVPPAEGDVVAALGRAELARDVSVSPLPGPRPGPSNPSKP
ncbi:GH36-type glycosyl hydrolase domain-containing protein [Tundrisphaera sp. TA3]|uniref:GH36-type glycosyl hydrolase domain-containing protein n=1 Tax=Tundrisphaera sp. TA3 TaxID=3435775 RepID=UPI003EB7E54C